MQKTPLLYTPHESYINPSLPKWQSRYYSTLFQKEQQIEQIEQIKQICQNYLQALEWVFKYYTQGCIDWRWKYNYSYPPLLSDILEYMRSTPITEIKTNKKRAYSSYQQLAYVLPYQYLNLLPIKYCEILRTKYAEYYPQKWDFQWAFCRYFWEAHPVLKEIDINQLEFLSF